MIQTYGLTHIGLAVRDVERSSRFYHEMFGVREVYRDAETIQGQTPGSDDVIVFEQSRTQVGEMRGMTHIGFRLVNPKDIEAAVDAARRADAKILERGEFVPGEPYVFVADPHGYKVEIWFRLPGPAGTKQGRSFTEG